MTTTRNTSGWTTDGRFADASFRDLLAACAAVVAPPTTTKGNTTMEQNTTTPAAPTTSDSDRAVITYNADKTEARAENVLCSDGKRRTVRLNSGTGTGATWPGRVTMGGKSVQGYVRATNVDKVNQAADLVFVGKGDPPSWNVNTGWTTTPEVKVAAKAVAEQVVKDTLPALDRIMGEALGLGRPATSPRRRGGIARAEARAAENAAQVANGATMSSTTTQDPPTTQGTTAESPAPTAEPTAPVKSTKGKGKGSKKAKGTPATPKATRVVVTPADGKAKFPGVVVSVRAEDTSRNGFLLVGKVSKAMRLADIPVETVTQFQEDATAAFYDAMLRVCAKWVGVQMTKGSAEQAAEPAPVPKGKGKGKTKTTTRKGGKVAAQSTAVH